MPTTWDETKVLAADIGRYVVVARRKGARWYIAGIGNEEGHSLLLEPIMEKGRRLMAGVLYRDGDAAHYVDNPTSWVSEAVHWQGEQSLEIRMQPGGGFLMVLE
jgi:alpha-glucosidase